MMDCLSARRYRHAALGDRPVVRLVPDNLAEAADLTQEFYGFERPARVHPVGQQARQGLGFPDWALIHDPDRAALALEVVKEFRVQAKIARSRPGAAKDGMVAIGVRLGRSVPHFLPSFYEECGRTFLALENANMATHFFNKAREAEKVHALQVDENLRRDTFLEFALAGAVAIKALSEYAAELTRAHQPDGAYQHFYELCLRRTLGGLPPWGQMLKELGRLAKSAGHEVRAEERKFFEQVLESAALARAPIEFWTSASTALKGLCQDSDSTRQRLLDLRPVFSGDLIKNGESWYGLLEEWGLLEQLAASPQAGPWLISMLGYFRSWHHPNQNPDRFFAWTRRLAEPLRTLGQPLQLPFHWHRIDLDFLELLVELKIPADWSQVSRNSIDLAAWSRQTGPDRRRDPLHLSQMEEMWPFFRRCLDGAVGAQPFESLCLGKPGWTRLRRRYFEEVVDQLEREALPGLRQRLERWEQGDSSLLAAYPDLQARLCNLPLDRILARTVQALLIQELAWPVAEQAAAELGGAKLELYGLYPHLVLVAGGRAIAVSRDAVLARHDLVLPAGVKPRWVVYLEGQFLVQYHDQGSKAYWSDTAHEPFEIEGYLPDLSGHETVPAPQGGVSIGERALDAGDREWTSPSRVLYDGHTCWRLEYEGRLRRLREFDPQSGGGGRISLPTFLEDFVTEGATVDLVRSSLMPHSGESLWGARDGLTGWRLRQWKDGELEGQGIDGRSWRGALPDYGYPSGLLQVPGSRTLLWEGTGGRRFFHPEQHYQVASPQDGADWLFWYLSPNWWNLLTVRDPAISQSLRAFDASRAARLLASPSKPDIADPVVGPALTGMAEQALRLQRRLAVFLVTQQAPRPARGDLTPLLRSLDFRINDLDLGAELDYLREITAQPAAPAPGGLIQKIKGLFGAKAAPTPAPAIKARGLYFIGECAGRLGALAWRSVAPFTAPGDAEAAWTLLERWLETDLVQRSAHFRRLEFRERLSRRLIQVGKSTFAVDSFYNRTLALEYSRDGVFRLPPEAVEKVSEPCAQARWDRADRLTAFLREARARGPLAWNPEWPTRLAAETGLAPAEATLLLTGLPFLWKSESNFLPGELREQLWLKVSEAGAARETFAGLTSQQRLRLYNDAMPLEVAQLWEDPVPALAASWNALMGRRLSVSEEQLAALQDLELTQKPASMLAILAQGEAGPLGRDGNFRLTESGLACSPEGCFDGVIFQALVHYTGWFFESAPVGEEVRQSLVGAWRLAEQRLLNPQLIFSAVYVEGIEEVEAVANLYQAFAAKPGQVVTDMGASLLLRTRRAIVLFFRPARPLDPPLRKFQASLDTLQLDAFSRSREAGFAELLRRLEETPVPPGGYECNPLLSAPDLVEQAQARFSLSQPAAVLYLQTLALLRPTSKNVQLWNDWKPAVYKKAAAELVAAGLLLEAKRARAGRAHFLPGPWEPLPAPDLPVESFKLPLYPRFALRLMALKPLHQLFAQAWDLVCQGKGPAYEEIS